MKEYYPEDLIKKYINDVASEEEKMIVESWHIYDLKNNKYVPTKEEIAIVHKRTWDKLAFHYQEKTRTNRKLVSKIAIAATLFLISCLIIYNHIKPSQSSPVPILIKNDVAAGGNKATLTLSDGKIISLSQTGKELVAIQGGVTIKNSRGLLAYKHQNNSLVIQTKNKLETPRGGKYQLLLPDGTKVWLNSASILTYPNSFSGNERKVILEGEAYFEVAKDPRKIFKVISKTQTIEVLGTHFNIKSYEEDGKTQTSLVQGKVKIFRGLQYEILKPGQTSFTTENSKYIKIETTNLEKDLSWKNNEFIFTGDDLKTIMREVARWYDVEVIYKGNFDQSKYFGVVSRSKNISAVLKMLQLTGKINSKIEGRRITLMN